VERQHKMAYDQRNIMTVPAVLAIAAQFAAIVNDCVTDPVKRLEARDRLAKLLGNFGA
jgi:hypothetical protein